ncbi:MAG: YkgJ family cysteine cluster protein [Candidatus Woesearchaeota archaeon]
MENEIPFVGITKATDEKNVIRFGKCDKGKACEECSKLCQYGSGALSDQDYEKIAKHLGITVAKLKMNYLEPIMKFGTTRYKPKLKREKGKHYGKCIFYNDQEKCTIHGVKPLECKTSTCSPYGSALSEWFLLNHFVDPSNPHSIREWAIRLNTHPTIPGGTPEELIQNKETLKKIMNYDILS